MEKKEKGSRRKKGNENVKIDKRISECRCGCGPKRRTKEKGKGKIEN